jgi:hypothetical protein
MTSTSPPPKNTNRRTLPSNPFPQHAPPLLLQKPDVFAISPNVSPRAPVIAFYTHVVVRKTFRMHGTIRPRLPAVTPHRAESGSPGQTGGLNPPAPQIQKLEPRAQPPLPPSGCGALCPFGAARSGPKPALGHPGRANPILKPEVGSQKSGSVQNHRLARAEGVSRHPKHRLSARNEHGKAERQEDVSHQAPYAKIRCAAP